MEPCDFADKIRAEKANTLARYRTFSRSFQLIEVFVAVAVISWTSTRLPLVFKFSSEYVSAFSSYFMNQHVVFLVANAIVFVCVILSRYSDSGSDDSGIRYDDVKRRFIRRKITSDDPNPKSEVQNPIVLNKKSVNNSESETVVETASKKATNKIVRFQRTRSDKLKSEIPVKSRRELRRSVTEMRRRTAVTSGGEESTVKSFESVEKLSNEEFRIAVERFISKQQRFLKQQSMVEED